MVTTAETFRNRRVLVTGHTGFKGAWLAEWLLLLGADVTGFALPPPTSPSLFAQLGLGSRLRHLEGDVRDPAALRRAIDASRPDFVFHLAAQALVRRSYREPLLTWESNLTGSLHLLEALRDVDWPCAAVFVTTDKVYENREWDRGYGEEDALGGRDPYSASKAAAELAVSSWRSSFFPARHPVRLASARAGNVIGGGDWAQDRIVPDAMRALAAGESIRVRNPRAMRPWQHVLEALSGYLLLAAQLAASDGGAVATAFNFGPPPASTRTVESLTNEILKSWPGQWHRDSAADAPHEAEKLQLATDRASRRLGWRPRWSFEVTVANTVQWYRLACDNPPADRLRTLTCTQIRNYEASLP
jgi:CDP-glucose 4,6-dehydratase